MTTQRAGEARAGVVNTGLWIAAARALESARPDRLFNDPWAARLAGDTGRAALDAAPYNPFLPVRTRYFDDAITAAVGEGLQIVLLGAGADTRAFRLPLPASCTVFEIDFAEALEAKELVLQTEKPGCRRSLVPADLTGVWTDALLDAGFDTSAATMWVAEGLFFYLTAGASRSLIGDTAALSAAGSSFAADIFGTGLLALESMAPLVAARKGAGQELPFCADHPEQLFSAGGWSGCSVLYPGQPEANFGRLAPVPAGHAGGQSTLRTHLVMATL